MREESAESLRLEELGSRIRNQILLSDNAHESISALVETALCLTWIKWPLTGMAEKGGLRCNVRSSDIQLQTSSQVPGSTENWLAGIVQITIQVMEPCAHGRP